MRRYYRHFEAHTFCDWIDWWGEGGGYFRFELFRLDLTIHHDNEDAERDRDGSTEVTLSVSLLGFGFTLTVGHWTDYEREADAIARDDMKETLRRRLGSSS